MNKNSGKKSRPKKSGHNSGTLNQLHRSRIILRKFDTIVHPHTNQDPTLSSFTHDVSIHVSRCIYSLVNIYLLISHNLIQFIYSSIIIYNLFSLFIIVYHHVYSFIILYLLIYQYIPIYCSSIVYSMFIPC